MSATCRCRGECGSGRCLGTLTGGRPCGARSGTFHLVDGRPVRIYQGRCYYCHAALGRTRHRRQLREDRITTGDGQTNSMFALLARGGFS
ncbi:hypothetical protein GCM10027174_44940 [Salinifilum aidingensis]